MAKLPNIFVTRPRVVHAVQADTGDPGWGSKMFQLVKDHVEFWQTMECSCQAFELVWVHPDSGKHETLGVNLHEWLVIQDGKPFVLTDAVFRDQIQEIKLYANRT